MWVHICNTSSWEVEAGDSPKVQGQLSLHIKFRPVGPHRDPDSRNKIGNLYRESSLITCSVSMACVWRSCVCWHLCMYPPTPNHRLVCLGIPVLTFFLSPLFTQLRLTLNLLILLTPSKCVCHQPSFMVIWSQVFVQATSWAISPACLLPSEGKVSLSRQHPASAFQVAGTTCPCLPT